MLIVDEATLEALNRHCVKFKFMFTNLRRQLTKWAQSAIISLPAKLLTKNIFLDICFPNQMICNRLKIDLVFLYWQTNTMKSEIFCQILQKKVLQILL